MIRSGILAQGPMVAGLERECAELVGVKHAVAVNNVHQHLSDAYVERIVEVAGEAMGA